MSEHDDQCQVFQWAELNYGKWPELWDMFAIPNQGGGGKPAIIRGIKMVKEGLKKGVPDIFLPAGRTRTGEALGEPSYYGLFVEMKHGKNKPSKEQMVRIAQLKEAGYKVAVCYGPEEAIKAITDYLNL